MISNTWRNAALPTAPADDDADPPEPLLRPVWEDEPDETDLPPLRQRPGASPRLAGATPSAPDFHTGIDLATLLGPLCDATEALARLDARAAAAPEALRDGLIARLSLTEAAGWLAQAHAWVHPLDLALRDLALVGSTAPAVTGSGSRVLPHTFRGRGQTAWEDQTFDDMAEGDRAVADALALARLLRRLATARERTPFDSVAAAESTLTPFGGGPLDPGRFAQWRAAMTPSPPRPPNRAGQGGQFALPPLLLAARAAETWMVSGVAARPTPLQAVLAAVCLLARRGAVRTVFVPVWAAYPTIGYGARDALPALRSDVAARIGGWGGGGDWMVAFLHLVAEGARAGLRELDRLLAVADRAHALMAKADRRSRLSDAVDAALHTSALTPKALASQLRITPQTATALLRELRAVGLVQEVTGRRSFRAFAA